MVLSQDTQHMSIIIMAKKYWSHMFLSKIFSQAKGIEIAHPGIYVLRHLHNRKRSDSQVYHAGQLCVVHCVLQAMCACCGAVSTIHTNTLATAKNLTMKINCWRFFSRLDFCVSKQQRKKRSKLQCIYQPVGQCCLSSRWKHNQGLAHSKACVISATFRSGHTSPEKNCNTLFPCYILAPEVDLNSQAYSCLLLKATSEVQRSQCFAMQGILATIIDLPFQARTYLLLRVNFQFQRLQCFASDQLFRMLFFNLIWWLQLWSG